MSTRHLYIALLAVAIVAAWPGRGWAAHTLLNIEPDKAHPRNSEGDIIELADGRLCLIYTRFSGGAGDDSAADLAMRTSADNGRTWTDDQIVVRREGGRNVMSASLLRLKDGRIALFYLRKVSLADCRPVMRVSADEGATWSDTIDCVTDEVGYYVLNNDRAVQLSTGRLVLPVAQHNRPGLKRPDWSGVVMCYLSDDDGKTWRRSRDQQMGFDPNGKRVSTQEPGVVELNDGRLMMYCRSNGGSQYVAYSPDGGDTWSKLQPSNLASPLSPATIERIPWNGRLLCVWNDHSGAHPFPAGKRTPLCIAVSDDEGKTWSRSLVLEGDPQGWYCYTSMTFVNNRVLLAYCAGDRKVGHLNRLRITSVSAATLDDVARGVAMQMPATAPFQSCLDYGRSFINTNAVWNSPRFQVESRLTIRDEKTGETVEYWQCGSCKSERTFAAENLFTTDNYDFLPVFSRKEGVVFRRGAQWQENHREVRPVEQWWDGIRPALRSFRGRVLRTADEVFAAMDAGLPIVGQTQLHDDATGRTAVIEYPIKTINWHREKQYWQVDTGPILLPDLTATPDRWSHTIKLAYIAFRAPDWADFVVDSPMPIIRNGVEVAKVIHYSKVVHRQARNMLMVQEK